MTASFIILKKIIPGMGTARICASSNNSHALMMNGWEIDLPGRGGFGFESEKDAWTMFARCEPGEVSDDLC